MKKKITEDIKKNQNTTEIVEMKGIIEKITMTNITTEIDIIVMIVTTTEDEIMTTNQDPEGIAKSVADLVNAKETHHVKDTKTNDIKNEIMTIMKIMIGAKKQMTKKKHQ